MAAFGSMLHTVWSEVMEAEGSLLQTYSGWILSSSIQIDGQFKDQSRPISR